MSKNGDASEELQNCLPHYPSFVLGGQEIEFLSKMSDTLIIAEFSTRMADIAAPKAALRAKSLDKATQVHGHVAKWVGLTGEVGDSRKFDGDIWTSCEWHDQIKPLADFPILRPSGCKPHVIDN